MAAESTFLLFPDGRDYETPVVLANQAIRARNTASGAEYHPPFHPVSSIANAPRAWRSVGRGMTPDEMLGALKGADWAYPALAVYRTAGEDRWSFVYLGMGMGMSSSREDE